MLATQLHQGHALPLRQGCVLNRANLSQRSLYRVHRSLAPACGPSCRSGSDLRPFVYLLDRPAGGLSLLPPPGASSAAQPNQFCCSCRETPAVLVRGHVHSVTKQLHACGSLKDTLVQPAFSLFLKGRMISTLWGLALPMEAKPPAGLGRRQKGVHVHL